VGREIGRSADGPTALAPRLFLYLICHDFRKINGRGARRQEPASNARAARRQDPAAERHGGRVFFIFLAFHFLKNF
jgi:hypothetical protein